MLPQEEELSKGRQIKGGAFVLSDNNPFSMKRDLNNLPLRGAINRDTWLVAHDSAQYYSIFEKLDFSPTGKLSGKPI